jgi:nicotinamide mononucleotide transporter
VPDLDWLELVAVLFGIVSVYLSVRQIIWSWPTAIVNVSLYFLIFGREQLYALMGLQVFYAVISAYGWYNWLFGGENRTVLKVSRTPRPWALALPVIWGVGLILLGVVQTRATENPIPFVDSALAVASLIAMWMMSRKYLENWAVWIAVDVVSIVVFIRQGLWLTAFLYAVFLFLSARGLVEWSRSLRAKGGALSAER